MRMLLLAAALLGMLHGVSAPASAQETDEDANAARLGEVERKVKEAEDVIVEQVLALRREMKALQARVAKLEAELAAVRRSSRP